jgi:DNA-binding beta-propeller fold protein YncE
MLALRGYVDLPRPGAEGPSDFDHGDVYHPTGRVFVAHTQAGAVEVFDGPALTHVATIPDCPEASGVLVAQADHLVFAAERGAGRVLVIDASALTVQRVIAVDPRPNGLAWDVGRRRLLVADVAANTARLVTPDGDTLAVTSLPGRPRWCVYDAPYDRFLANIREPACVVALAAETGDAMATWPVASAGPHGLDLDPVGGRAFVACDDGVVVTLDLATGQELARVAIPGAPDAIWYNAGRERLYVAIEDPGVIASVNMRTMTVGEEVKTELGAHTTAFDDARQRLYVFLPISCRAAIYEESKQEDDEPDVISSRRTEERPDCGAVTQWEDEGGASAKREEDC